MAKVALIPKRGTLTARHFENPTVGIPLTLFFDMTIPLRPFKYEGELQRTAVRLDFINFKVSDWRELSEREFTFPKNPNAGYIDGSICIVGIHAPADATRIRFGPLKGNTLPASLEIEFDFTYEGPGELGKVAVAWNVELKIDPTELDRVMQQARRIAKHEDA